MPDSAGWQGGFRRANRPGLGGDNPRSSAIRHRQTATVLFRHFGQMQIEPGLRQQGGQLEHREPRARDLGMAIEAGFILHGFAAALGVVQKFLR